MPKVSYFFIFLSSCICSLSGFVYKDLISVIDHRRLKFIVLSMCSHWMESFQGDLTDIVRASSGGGGSAGGEGDGRIDRVPEAGWEFPMNFLGNPDEDFGYPFTRFRDPLLRDTDPHVSGSGLLQSSCFFKPLFGEGGLVGFPVGEELNKGQKVVAPTSQIQNEITASSSKSKTDGGSGRQIPSPGNKGIKRRKNQAKKVVCIPAPLPANSRSSGEVVPSDLWAWRKYGQKPIKGSPFPRAYYKCSSLKGCSARKQVERSRTDPNMLVITYSSEHNHPWPTQRNALAGSTRSQSSKKPLISPLELDKPPLVMMKQESDHHQEPIYKPTLPNPNHYEDNFFSDFPIDDGPMTDNNLDPFISFYDWNCNKTASYSGGDSPGGRR